MYESPNYSNIAYSPRTELIRRNIFKDFKDDDRIIVVKENVSKSKNKEQNTTVLNFLKRLSYITTVASLSQKIIKRIIPTILKLFSIIRHYLNPWQLRATFGYLCSLSLGVVGVWQYRQFFQKVYLKTPTKTKQQIGVLATVSALLGYSAKKRYWNKNDSMISTHPQYTEYSSSLSMTSSLSSSSLSSSISSSSILSDKENNMIENNQTSPKFNQMGISSIDYPPNSCTKGFNSPTFPKAVVINPPASCEKAAIKLAWIRSMKNRQRGS